MSHRASSPLLVAAFAADVAVADIRRLIAQLETASQRRSLTSVEADALHALRTLLNGFMGLLT